MRPWCCVCCASTVPALRDNGTVVASVPEAARRKRGRPAELLALNSAAGHVLGIEFARRAVRVAAMDAGHEIVGTVVALGPSVTGIAVCGVLTVCQVR